MMRKAHLGLVIGLMLAGCAASHADPFAEHYAAAHPHGDSASRAQAELASADGPYDARAHGFGRPRFPSH